MAMGRSHSFTPVAIETLGAIGPKPLAFIRDLGYRMKQRTGEERVLTYLLQRLSVAIQRGNSASAMDQLETNLPSCLFVCLFIIYLFIYYFIFCLISHKSNLLFKYHCYYYCC